MAEIVMIPYFVHRELGVRVPRSGRPRLRLEPAADLLAAAGAVVGERRTAPA